MTENILRFPKGREEELPFAERLVIKVPEDMNPYNTAVQILCSIDRARFRFNMPRESEIFANVEATQENLSKALRSGESIEFDVLGQEVGDCVCISYSGTLINNYLATRITSSMFKYTSESG